MNFILSIFLALFLIVVIVVTPLTFIYYNKDINYGLTNMLTNDDDVVYITPKPISNVQIPTPPGFLNITSPPPDFLPTDASMLDFILIKSSNSNVKNAIYMGSYIDPDIGALVESTIIICSVVLEADGRFFLNTNTAMSVLLNLNDTSNGIIQYVTRKNYYTLLNSLQQSIVKKKVNVHLPSITEETKYMIVQDGLIFRNGIQMGMDSLLKGNLIISGIYGTIVFNIASMENGYVNYLNNKEFLSNPKKFYSWVFNKSFSAGFQSNLPDITTIKLAKYNIVDSISFSNGIRMDCANDYTIDISGYEALIQITLQETENDLISFINLNNGSVWTYNYENDQRNNLFFDPVPDVLPPPTLLEDIVSTIVIKNSRPNLLGLLIETCNFSNPTACNIATNFVSNVSMCIRSVLVQEDDSVVTNPNEMARVYFHFNSSLCSSLIEIQQKDSIYILDCNSMEESFTNVSYNPFENYYSNATTGSYMVVKDALYFSNKCSISLDNSNFGNCIISTPVSQIEYNVSIGFRSEMNQSVTNIQSCLNVFGSNFNYCPDTKVFYCCGGCEQTATCPSNPNLKLCACSPTAVTRYISKTSAQSRPYSAWCLYETGPGQIYTDISTLQTPIYTSNYFSVVYNSILFDNGIYVSVVANQNSLLLQGTLGNVMFGGDAVLAYSNMISKTWLFTLDNDIKIEDIVNQIETLPPNTVPSPTSPPLETFDSIWDQWAQKRVNVYQSHGGFINGFGGQNSNPGSFAKEKMALKIYSPSSNVVNNNFDTNSGTLVTRDYLEFDAKGDAINAIHLFSPPPQEDPYSGVPFLSQGQEVYVTPYYEKVALDARRLVGTPTNCAWTAPKNRSYTNTNTSQFPQCPNEKYLTGMRFENSSKESNGNQETIYLKCCSLDQTSEPTPSTCGSSYWAEPGQFGNATTGSVSDNDIMHVECPNGDVPCGFSCVTQNKWGHNFNTSDKCSFKCCPSLEKRGFTNKQSVNKNSCEPHSQNLSDPGKALVKLKITKDASGKTYGETVEGDFSYLDGKQGSCEWTEWKNKSYSCSQNDGFCNAAKNGPQCPDGKYCAQIEFKHACGEDDPADELVRLYCCANNPI
jgi:hypothetical protein